MSVKTDVIAKLWPNPDHGEIRQLAMQRPEITDAVASYCAAASKPKFAEHFAAAKCSVEAAFATGARATVSAPGTRSNPFKEMYRQAAAAKDRIRDRSL